MLDNNITSLLKELCGQIKSILCEELEGIYLYGSLVYGDFDSGISDIDLLVITKSDLDNESFKQLDMMHKMFVQKHPTWDDRIEIAYVSEKALAAFKTKAHKIAVISPGEAFNFKTAGCDWLINWYLIREQSKTLYGRDPKTIIPPISQEEFVNSVKKQVKDWLEWVVQTKSSRPFQAYAILTMCRALYVCNVGKQVSKKEAALWAIKKLPEWAELIKKALEWRIDYKNNSIDHESTFQETCRFVNHVYSLIETTQPDNWKHL